MKRMIPSLLALAALTALTVSGSDRKEEERLQNCGTVLREIMDIPEDIPQDLIDKAECIIVYPSVLKAAFVVGGSYGRGAMTCRSGDHFTRTLERPLHDGSGRRQFWLPDWRRKPPTSSCWS